MRDLENNPRHILSEEARYRDVFTPRQKSEFLFAMSDGNIGRITTSDFDDEKWEHAMLTPTTVNRCPTWPEMVSMKNFVWYDKDVVIQVHPRRQNYINYLPYSLHQWKFKGGLEDLSAVKNTTKLLLKDRSNSAKAFKGVANGRRFIAIYGGSQWPSWEDVCFFKNHYFGPDCPAVQYNISKKFDLNNRFLLTVWDASSMELPPKELV